MTDDVSGHHRSPRPVRGTASDTTNIMPATVKELALYPLCHNMFWAPCAAHVLGLVLKDKMKIQNIKPFLGNYPGMLLQ
jgi:hypothetical protein